MIGPGAGCRFNRRLVQVPALRLWKICLLLSLDLSEAANVEIGKCEATGEGEGNSGSCDAPTRHKCRLYMAESSIPGAGWGVYTSEPLQVGEALPASAASDASFLITDHSRHEDLRGERKRDLLGSGREAPQLDRDALVELRTEGGDWMPTNYYWKPSFLGLGNHADDALAIATGVGSMVNCHPGLVNIKTSPPDVGDGPRLDPARDPGAGAYTSHGGAIFSVRGLSAAASGLPAGSELFAEYGTSWFEDREKEVGMVPLSRDWRGAEYLLQKSGQFFERKLKALSGIDSSFREDLWEIVRDGTVHSARLRNALPETWEEAESATEELIKGGQSRAGQGFLARWMTPGAVRSLEWLEENGRCIDNIYPGHSQIDQAGRGAFALRSFQKGEIITTSPVMQIRRGRLKMYRKSFGGKVESAGEQLFLNYCYGHPNSTLLLFPYATGINLLNHGGVEGSNALLQWASNLPLHHSDWLNWTADAILAEETAGLTLEVVATKEIRKGQEILIDYGWEWEAAWEKHMQTWKSQSGKGEQRYVPADVMNKRKAQVKTPKEKRESPYPPNIKTACKLSQLAFHSHVTTQIYNGFDAFNYQPTGSSGKPMPCDVIAKDTGKGGKDTYVVLVRKKKKDDESTTLEPKRTEAVVMGVPREAILFIDKPYTDEQFLEGAFRHEIGLPQGMFSENWIDLS